MALSDVAMCSRALLGLGANSISSFDEGTAEGEVSSNLYEGVRDSLLSSYPWNFATAEMRLNRLVVEPIAGFKYAYQLPVDFLRILAAGDQGESRGANYRIQEKRLHTDNSDIIVRYIFRAPEENFPPWFAQLLIAHLKAEFAIPITDSSSKMKDMAQLAEKAFSAAKIIDSQEAPGDVIESNLLIGARG